MTQQKPSIADQEPKTTTKADAKKSPEKSLGRGILSTIGLLVTAPLIAFILITFVFQSFQVDGQSMDHTLQNGDRLIVWKIPRTLARVTKHSYIPGRGDVIVFNRTDLYEADGTQKHLIKRVVGLPGDRVVVKNGTITVYNQEHPGGFNPDQSNGFPSTIIGPTELDVDMVVKADEVFVCGDNRGNSIDSRTFGSIKSRDIIGRMVLRILPTNKFDSYL